MNSQKIFKTNILLLLIIIVSCSGVGLISEKYPEDFYRIPKLLPEENLESNPTFIVYSDAQAGFRINNKFLYKNNWATLKMLIFPFYELYWLGNGIVGAINWYRRTPDMAGPEQRMVRDAVYFAAKKDSVKFILNTGDISAHDGRRPDHWSSFLNINKKELPLLTEIPYLPVIGNHDRVNDTIYGGPNYRAIFQYPRFYVIDFPDGAVFILDSNFILDQKQEISDDLQDELFRKWFVASPGDEPSWLEKELSSRDVPFKIVAMHHPPISYNYHHSDWDNNKFGKDLLNKRKLLLELFRKYNVQVVFSGHDHLYQHNLLSSDDKEEKPIHLIVGGGGGTPLRPKSSPKKILEFENYFRNQNLKTKSLIQSENYHYSLVEIRSDSLKVKVVRIAKDQELSGDIIDQFVITK